MAVIQDNSSGVQMVSPVNVGGGANQPGTWRGFGSSWFNADNVATEDFLREQQLQNREMEFNAREAQKQRDYEERLSNTAYQRAVKDMQAAGINPLMAYSQGGAPVPSGSSASVSGHSASRGGSSDPMSSVVGGLLSIAGQFVGKFNKPAGAVIQVVGNAINGANKPKLRNNLRR